MLVRRAAALVICHRFELTRFLLKTRTEYLANSGINPEASPGGLQLSFGTTSDALLLGSAAYAAAAEDATTDSPQAQASFATILEWPRQPAAEANGSRSSQAALRNGEIESQQQQAAPMAEDETQPTSLRLLQTSPKRYAASDESVDLGMKRSFNRWIGVQGLAQAASVILIGILAATILAGLTRSSAVICFASLVPAMGACFQRFAMPSTTSSPRSQPSVLRRDFSLSTSYNFFSSSSSLLRRGMASRCDVAPLMG